MQAKGSLSQRTMQTTWRFEYGPTHASGEASSHKEPPNPPAPKPMRGRENLTFFLCSVEVRPVDYSVPRRAANQTRETPRNEEPTEPAGAKPHETYTKRNLLAALSRRHQVVIFARSL